jgi:DNA-binding NarL/FixJ family response regulator
LIKRPISADTKYAAITSEKIGRIKELVREGKTVKEIAELVGVSDPTVRKYKAEVAIETSDCLSESDQKVQ